MSSSETMEKAEKLYNLGYISYPRYKYIIKYLFFKNRNGRI
jgi:hypothetical protein